MLFIFKELWIKAGSGAKVRKIPLHVLAVKLGGNLCQCLPAVHFLTGSDYTSKIGTKKKAMKADPKKYLMQFGQSKIFMLQKKIFLKRIYLLKNFLDTNNLVNNINNAETYLVKVFSPKSNLITFDKLRYEKYCLGNYNTIIDLPPTTQTIKFHILRAFFATYNQIHCLDDILEKLDPTEYGYVISENCLLPKRVCDNIYPSVQELIPSCNCKTCSRKSCNCVREGVSCISFCACQNENSCKNKYKKF